MCVKVSTLGQVRARLLSTTSVRKALGGLVNIGTGPRTLVVHNVGAKGFGGLVNLGTGPRALVVRNVGAKGFGGLVLGLVHARLLSTASVRKALVQVQCFFGRPSKQRNVELHRQDSELESITLSTVVPFHKVGPAPASDGPVIEELHGIFEV